MHLNKKKYFLKAFLLRGWHTMERVAPSVITNLGATHSPAGPYMAQPLLSIPAFSRGWAEDLQWYHPTSPSASSVQLTIKH